MKLMIYGEHNYEYSTRIVLTSIVTYSSLFGRNTDLTNNIYTNEQFKLNIIFVYIYIYRYNINTY